MENIPNTLGNGVGLFLHVPPPYFSYRLKLLTIAERIETGWWDGADVARDYYRARDDKGRELWVFQDRKAARQWFLHGIFA